MRHNIIESLVIRSTSYKVQKNDYGLKDKFGTALADKNMCGQFAGYLCTCSIHYLPYDLISRGSKTSMKNVILLEQTLDTKSKGTLLTSYIYCTRHLSSAQGSKQTDRYRMPKKIYINRIINRKLFHWLHFLQTLSDCK